MSMFDTSLYPTLISTSSSSFNLLLFLYSSILLNVYLSYSDSSSSIPIIPSYVGVCAFVVPSLAIAPPSPPPPSGQNPPNLKGDEIFS
jgi:hypothetical protein